MYESNDDNFEYEPIKIKEILEKEITVPKMDGTPGSALYAIPFKLSRSPSALWERLFLQTWKQPPQWTSMHRSNIAEVIGDKIILDGTTIEEVEKYHKATLLLSVDEANRLEQEYIRQHMLKMEQEKLRVQKHREEISATAQKITFD